MNGMKTLYGVQMLLRNTSVDLSKGIVVLPTSLFLFLFFFLFFYFFVFLCPLWLFLFISHSSSLGSFHVSSFGIFYLCPLWDLFLTLGQHSIFYKDREDHTLYKY